MKISQLARVDMLIYPLAKSAQNTAISYHSKNGKKKISKYLTSLVRIRKKITLLNIVTLVTLLTL
jgi:hypothetical protein